MALKKKTAKTQKQKLIPVHVKLTQSEYDALIKRANWWCMGNLSAWFRYTGLRYVPKKTENVSQIIAAKK